MKLAFRLVALWVMVFSVLMPTFVDVSTVQARTSNRVPGCFYDSPPPPPEPSEDGPALMDAGVSTPYRQQAYVKASNPDAFDWFGEAIAISGDTMVVGAKGEASKAKSVNGGQVDDSVPSAGAVYVFVRDGTTWSQQAYLKSFAPDENDVFGRTVAISGDTIVVGASQEDSNSTGVNGNYYNDAAPDSGAVYVFVRNGTTWSQQAYIKASNAQAGDVFGSALSISGDTLVVGAPSEDSNAAGINGNQADNSLVSAGAAYVFTRSGSTWTQQAYLKASNAEAGDGFGVSVAVSGNSIVVGAPGEDSNGTSVNGNQADNSVAGSGAAYTFIRNGNTWSQQAYLKASNAAADNGFGTSAAMWGGTVLIGAPLAPDYDYPRGAAYVFTREAGNWSEEAFLTAADGDYNDEFGLVVGISGDMLVVGAHLECGDSTGINGDPYNYNAQNAGAAYAFARQGNGWRQVAYMKASNTNAEDGFGRAVGISGNTLVVGAHGEASNAKGVNGNQDDNSLLGAGAAYVFTLNPTALAIDTVNANPTTAASVDFTVTFLEESTGVDASDFKLVTTSKLTGVKILGVSGGPTVYTVKVSTGSGNGTIHLNLIDDDSILNAQGVPLGGVGLTNGDFTSGETYLVRLQSRTFRSEAALDGWMLSNSSTTPISFNTAGSLRVGDDDANGQYRSIVSFNTSSLPDKFVVVDGMLKIRKEAIVGTDPFTTHYSFYVTTCKGFFGNSAQLELADFDVLPSQCARKIPQYYVNGGGWYDIVLGNFERTHLNADGVTQFRMNFSRNHNNDASADYVLFYSGDAPTASYRPALVLEYYEP